MKPKEFFDTVALMRSFQKLYFSTRSSEALQEAKRLEREIDKEIDRVDSINKEPDLFTQPTDL